MPWRQDPLLVGCCCTSNQLEKQHPTKVWPSHILDIGWSSELLIWCSTINDVISCYKQLFGNGYRTFCSNYAFIKPFRTLWARKMSTPYWYLMMCFMILCNGIHITLRCYVSSYNGLYWNCFLTHWGRDEMPTISPTTFSTAFWWIKLCEFRLIVHWSLCL